MERLPFSVGASSVEGFVEERRFSAASALPQDDKRTGCAVVRGGQPRTRGEVDAAGDGGKAGSRSTPSLCSVPQGGFSTGPLARFGMTSVERAAAGAPEELGWESPLGDFLRGIFQQSQLPQAFGRGDD
jgi:hypothetical protein